MLGLWMSGRLDCGRPDAWTRHTGIPGLWTQVLAAGLWTLDAGLWTLDLGRWTLDATLWALGTGHYR